MKSLRSYLPVIGCVLASLCSPAWAATSLPFGEAVTGTITSAAQTNNYTFSANTGDVLNFTVVTTSSTSGTLGPCIALYDPNVKLVDSAGGSYNTDVTMNGYQALLSGTFTVLIRDCANTATGVYVVFVQKTNQPIGSVSLPFAQAQTGQTITSAAQSNAYTFSASANDVVSFTVVTTSSTSGTLGPCVALYNSAGTQLGSAGGSYAQQVEMNQVKLSASGTYNVLIRDCANTATGVYAVFVQKTNDPIGSVPILYDQVQTGNIGSAAQSNAYTLLGSVNDVLNFTVVTTKSTSGTLGPCILLYNSAGTPLLDSAGGSYNTNVQMNGYRIPASGTYNTLIKDCADTATGNYTLSVECIGVCPLPAPTLTSILPTSALAGSGGFTLTVNGTNFVNVAANSGVAWNDNVLPTTWVSSTQMTAAVPAAYVATAGLYPVTVFTPSPGGGTSSALPFTVNNPVPAIASLSPSSATAGAGAFTLTVNGSSLVNGSVVNWNGSSRSTTYVNSAQLTATITATDIAIANSASVTVFNPSPGGGLSAGTTFTINLATQTITFGALANQPLGTPPFPVSATASSGLPVSFNSQTTSVCTVSGSQVTLVAAGTCTIQATQAGNATYAPAAPVNQSFQVTQTAVSISSLSPASAAPGGPAFTLTVNGTNFVSGSLVEWNGGALATTYVSATQLTASVPAALIASVGTASVTVVNPGGATSAALIFTIATLAPVLVSPPNGATGVPLWPTLTWNPSGGATSYDIYFGTSSPPPLLTNTSGTSYATGTLTSGAAYYWQIVARSSSGSASSPTWFFTTGAPAISSRFVPVAPCRVADTRGPAGPFGGPTMTAGSTRSFPIPESGCNIPATGQAYSVNVTAVPGGPLGFLTLWPAGEAQPFVSTLNSFGGNVVANAAIVPVGSGGAVSVYVSNETDVILDINGYFESPGGANAYSFYAGTPCRVADTRNPTGQFGGPSMSADQTRDFPVPLSSCAIPATATAYSLNVTAVPDTHFLGYLTTWPTGPSRPLVSTLNSWTGKVVANAAIVPTGANGSISVFVTDPTDVILDINGYFGQPGNTGALSFYPLAPCRVADTRNPAGPFGGPEMQAGATRSFAIPASVCYVPSTAAAYSVNVTVVPDGPLSYLTAWPTGSAQAFVSTLNSFDGSVVANAAIVPAGTNGAISIFVTNPTHVILDINGYFAP